MKSHGPCWVSTVLPTRLAHPGTASSEPLPVFPTPNQTRRTQGERSLCLVVPAPGCASAAGGVGFWALALLLGAARRQASSPLAMGARVGRSATYSSGDTTLQTPEPPEELPVPQQPPCIAYCLSYTPLLRGEPGVDLAEEVRRRPEPLAADPLTHRLWPRNRMPLAHAGRQPRAGLRPRARKRDSRPFAGMGRERFDRLVHSLSRRPAGRSARLSRRATTTHRPFR